MTKNVFSTLFFPLVLVDILATYQHSIILQITSRSAILLALASYYFFQTKTTRSIPDYLMLFSYLVTLLAELFYIDTPLKNYTLVFLFLFIKVTIVLYLIIKEYRFYEVNEVLLTVLIILMSIISLVIVWNFNSAPRYLFIECLFTVEIGVIFSLSLFRKANKYSFEAMVMAIMTSAFSIILMSNNLYNYQVWLDMLARLTHAVGLLLLTFAILRSSLIRKN